MNRISKFRLFAVELPFHKPFKHAAAERRTSDSLFVACHTDTGAVGFGECLPRSYVTGETRDGAFELLRASILPRLVGMPFNSLEEVKSFLRQCDGKAPADWVDPEAPQTAAWCAVDIALLDAFGQAFGQPVRLNDRVALPPSARYSAVISSDTGLRFVKTMLKIRLFGIRQVKLKVEANSAVEAARRTRRWLGRACDIRVDANMAWTVNQALAVMAEMSRLGIHSFEQPIEASDTDGLARLVRESGLDVMVDESLSDRASLERLIENKACTVVNVRISKCGGHGSADRGFLRKFRAASSGEPARPGGISGHQHGRPDIRAVSVRRPLCSCVDWPVGNDCRLEVSNDRGKLTEPHGDSTQWSTSRMIDQRGFFFLAPRPRIQ